MPKFGKAGGVRIGLVVAFTLFLVACDWTPTQYAGLPGEGEPDKVTVYGHGDSLSYWAQTAWNPVTGGRSITDTLLDAGYTAQGFYLPGQMAANGSAAVANWPSSGVAVPDVYVLALGSNDMGSIGTLKDPGDPSKGVWTLEERLDQLDTYIDDLHELGVGCISAFNLPAISTAWHLDLYAPAWNELLENHPYVDHVEDWAATAEANVGEFDSIRVHFRVRDGDPVPIAYRAHYLHAANACTEILFEGDSATVGTR